MLLFSPRVDFEAVCGIEIQYGVPESLQHFCVVLCVKGFHSEKKEQSEEEYEKFLRWYDGLY